VTTVKATTIDSLKENGWQAGAPAAPRRLVCSIEGWDKTGKTHLAMTAPEPIIYLDLDVGTEGVIEKFSKELLWYQVDQPEKLGNHRDVMDRFGKIWADLLTRVGEALQLEEGTLVIDTFTEAYEIARLAHFGKLAQVQPHEYAKCYSDLREILRLASKSKMNTILLHKLGKDFHTGVPEMKGWSDLPYQVQAVLRTRREDTDNGPVFSAEVRSCRHKPNLMGKVLAQEMTTEPRGMPYMLDFGMLLDLIHG